MPSSMPAGMLTLSFRSSVTRPAAVAVEAGVGDHLAAALAGRAGALDREEARGGADPAVAVAGRADLGLTSRAWRRSPSRTVQTTLVGTSISAVLPLIGLLEADLHVVAEIGAALAAAGAVAAAPAAAHEVAEDVVEDVRHRGGEVVGEARTAAVLEGGMAEAVIGGALLRIAQALVGLVDFLELDLGGLVAVVAVGMELHGELAEGRLQHLLVAASRDAEDFVEVALAHSLLSPTPFAALSAESFDSGMRESGRPAPSKRATRSGKCGPLPYSVGLRPTSSGRRR